MCVLDPEGQVLIKSYIQTASVLVKVLKKTFAGGMYVDAYVGNFIQRILSKTNNFEILVQNAKD